jgi:hypothetical protein
MHISFNQAPSLLSVKLKVPSHVPGIPPGRKKGAFTQPSAAEGFLKVVTSSTRVFYLLRFKFSR